MSITTAFSATTVASDVATTYAIANVTDKAAMRAAIAVAITSAIRVDRDIDLADHYTNLQAAMVAVTKSTVAPVDYAAKVADLRATLLAAVTMIDAGTYVMPSGVDRPFGPIDINGTVDTKLATKLSTVTGRKSGGGNVANYVASVVTDAPQKVSALRAAWTPSTDYPSAAPSAGAIGAMLDRMTLDSDMPFVEVTVDGTRAVVAA